MDSREHWLALNIVSFESFLSYLSFAISSRLIVLVFWGYQICIRSKQLVMPQYFVTCNRSQVKFVKLAKECVVFSQFQNDLPLSAYSKKYTPETVLDPDLFKSLPIVWAKLEFFLIRFHLSLEQLPSTISKYSCQIELPNTKPAEVIQNSI